MVTTTKTVTLSIEAQCLVGCGSHKRGSWYTKKTFPKDTSLAEAQEAIAKKREVGLKGVYRLHRVQVETITTEEDWL